MKSARERERERDRRKRFVCFEAVVLCPRRGGFCRRAECRPSRRDEEGTSSPSLRSLLFFFLLLALLAKSSVREELPGCPSSRWYRDFGSSTQQKVRRPTSRPVPASSLSPRGLSRRRRRRCRRATTARSSRGPRADACVVCACGVCRGGLGAGRGRPRARRAFASRLAVDGRCRSRCVPSVAAVTAAAVPAESVVRGFLGAASSGGVVARLVVLLARKMQLVQAWAPAFCPAPALPPQSQHGGVFLLKPIVCLFWGFGFSAGSLQRGKWFQMVNFRLYVRSGTLFLV